MIEYHGSTWAAKQADDIAAAQHSITMTAISALPPTRNARGVWPAWWAALTDAARRGVDVQMILPAPSRAHPATRANARTAERLAAAGVRPVLVPGPRLLHAKTALIDDAIVWCGSGNYTAAAAHHNYEAYTRTTDPQMVAAIAAFHHGLRGEANEN